MADLAGVLSTVRDRITKYQRQSIGEQDTKAALIVPVLRALGWDVEDLEDVKLEYRRRPSDNPVDYALFLLREPRLFIEAKPLGAHLGDHKWANQILTYAMAAGVEWVALSDGNEYRLYNSHAAVPVEEKLFRIIQVADPATQPAETLGLLSKSQLQDHLIDQYWKTEFVDRQVRETLRALFAAEPDPSVIRLVHGREVLGSVGSTSPSSADEETDEGADDEVEEVQHRPIVQGLSERESGFPTPTGRDPPVY